MGNAGVDAAGHGNTLAYSSTGTTLGQTGAIVGDSNTSATFNGSTGNASEAAAPTVVTTNWSVEAWVNPTNLNQAGTMVYNGISASNGYGFGISSATSLTTAGSELTGIVNGAIADSGYGFPSPGTWYHVVMTRDTTTIRWYVNGKLTSKTSTLAPSAPGARFSLGAGINSSSQVVRPFLGGIDEAAVYPSQLSAGRIAAHAQDGALPISGIGQWTVRSPTTVPSGRYDTAYAYDASASDATHGKLVVFGGENSASAAVQETWTWDGTNWTKLTPATQPSARWGARMVYDSATGLTYLFGGYTGSTYLNDTWKWDGTTWTVLAPTTKPSIRLDGAMAYDAATSAVVLFGGSKPPTYYADTYSWNGTNWTALSPSPAPTVRASAAVAYDSGNSKVVLYGGYNGSTYLADTWLWNGTTWTSQSPGTAPTARAGAAMAYNPITATSMLFGGVNGTSYYAETWSWDGTNWGLETSTSNPGARSTAVLAWDTATSNLVLFDGRNSSAPLTDTWNRNTPPGVATGISGVAGNAQVTVSWTAAPNGGSTITKYLVTASPGGATMTVTGNPAASTGIVTGLSNGTPYTFTVLATNALGTGVTSGASPAVTPVGPPGAPTGATATAGNGQATVNWTAPVSNGGAAISSYTITSTPGNFTTTVSGSPPATSGTVIGLTNGTQYTFTVYATNAAGNGPLSGASNSVTPSTIPGQPTNVVASGGNQQVSLTWTAPANNGATITSYTATAAPGGATGTVNGNPAAAAVTVTGLTNGTPYTFTVVAHNANGDGPASAPSNSATPSILPGAPTGVTAAASNQQATINWTAPVPNGGAAVSGYTVTPFIGTNAGTPTQVAAPTTTATISGLTNLTTYTFQVTATNTSGAGPAGTSNAVTPAVTPQAPTNVGATAGDQQVTVNWTPPDPGGSSITAYTITPYIGGSAGTPVGAGASATSVIVIGLTNGTAYTFQIYAANSYGHGFVGTSPAATPAGPPSVPTNITATSGNGSATVTWGAPTDNGGSTITGYTVTPVLNGNAGTPVVVGGSVYSTPVTGLTNGSTYTFQVFATNAVGNGTAGASTPLMVGTPGSPGNVSATGGANRASVTWTAAASNGSAITGYTATAYVAGLPNLSIALGPSATAATVSGLKGGTSYTIQVVATNSYGAGPGAFSSAVTPTGSATTYASTVLADGAANYERMSDTGAVAADSSGNGAAGAYQGTYTHGATGLIGSDLVDAATSFDGSSAYVSAPTQTALQGNHARTVEVWFNSVSSAQQMLFDSGGAGAGQSFYIGTTSDGGVCGAPQNTAGAYVGFGGNDDVYIPGLHLNDGSTHYVVVTLQGTSLSVYVDSVAVSGYVYNNGWSTLTAQPFTLPTAPNTTGNPIWIGHGRSQVSCSGNTYFAGIIDEVAVYPTALSAAQVTNHFGLAADGAPGAPVSPSAVAGTNKATISWGASQPNGAPVTTYTVTAFVNGITSQNEISVGGSATSAVITGLVTTGQYDFQVQARNAFGYSSNSTYTGFITVTGLASTYPSTVIADGPIAYYRLGDTGSTATDSSGNANTAAIRQGVTEGAGGALPGDSDTAFTFAAGLVQDQSFATLPSGTSARTYEVWVKTTYTGDQVLLSYAHTNGCGYLANGLVLTSGGQVGFITGWDCNSWSVTSIGFTPPYSITNGAWHQIATTWNGTTVVMYLDGQPIGTPQSYSSSLGSADTSGLMLGAIYGSNYMTGSLDEVAIYPSALSATQILNHFQASGNNQPSAPTNVASAGGANQATVSWTAAASNGSPITGYLVTAMQGGVAKNAVSVSAATTSVIMTGLQGGTAYTFQVQAANNFGFGPAGTSLAATPTGSSTTYASTVQGDSPSYYYRLDDTSAMVADSSGNGRLAYASGGYTQSAAGALANDTDTATTLTANGKAQFTQGTGLPSGTSARTYEVWVKTTYTGDQVLLSYAHSNGCGYLANGLVLTSGGQVGFITGWDCNSWAVTSIRFTPAHSVTDGIWHQIAATWDGTTVVIYVDGQSIGSHAYSTSLGSADNSGLMLGVLYGSNYMSGSLDEVSIYSSALSAAQILNHYEQSGAGAPPAPTNVTAVAGTNSAVVSWTAVPQGQGAAASYMITPQLAGGSSLAALSVSASTTSANVAGLPSGVSVSFAVEAINQYGTGAAATSSAVTISGPQPAPNLDRSLAIVEAGNVPYGIYYDGWVSTNLIPASSLTNWTIEGWVWAVTSQDTQTGNMAWGLLDTTHYTDPNGDDHTVPSWDTPLAGINFNIGDLHGLNNCCDVSFVWPGGKFTPPNNQPGDNQLGAILSSSTPVYVAIDYDGTNVRGYINGTQSFSQPASAAIPKSAWAGFFDETELRAGAFDGFRVSNMARYTGTSFGVPTTEPPADANTLVDYKFNDYPVGALDGTELSWHNPWTPVRWGYFTDSSSQDNPASFMAFSLPWQIGSYAFSDLLIQPFEISGGLSPGELADECNGVNTGTGGYCEGSTDMSIPGRGPALSLVRTYNTFSAFALGTGCGSSGGCPGFGYGWSSSYGAHLSTDEFGDVTVYDAMGGSEFYANQSGSLKTASYVSTALVFSGGDYTLTDKQGGKVVFDSSGKLIQEIDPNPTYVTNLSYVNGYLSTVTEPGGRTLTYSYGGNGQVSAVTDGTRTATYHYDDGNLNLTSVVDVLGGVTSYTYDSAHRLLTIKDPICNLTPGCYGMVNVYDSNGRIGRQTDPAGNTAIFTYASSWPLFTTTATDPRGNQTVYDYALGIPIDIVQAANTPLSAKTTFAYDPATLGAAAITKPDSQTDTATYDAMGNQLTTTDSLGNKMTFTYNSLSEPLTVQNPMGVTTTYTYDANGNPLTSSTPLVGSGLSQVTTLTYGDPNHPGDVTAVTDPTNRTITYAFDSYGDLVSSTDPLNNKTSYAYDTLGRLISIVSPLGNVNGGNPAAFTTIVTYNAARQPLTITDPLGHQVVNQYDVGGHLVQTTDANGNITKSSYDLDGRPTTSTAGYGTSLATTQQTIYDPDGNVLSKIDGLNHTLASYTYDVLNRQATSADGSGRTTSYGYDSVNRLTSAVDPLNKTTTFAYDSSGRLIGTSYTDSSSETYTYNANGQLLTMVDGTGTTTNVFDSLHQLIQQTDGAGHVVGYGYDLAGRVTSIAYPGGNCDTQTLCVTRQYDTAGRPSSVRDWLSHTTTFGYDANSNLTGVTYPNGVVAAWTYNNANQLTAISDVNGGNTILGLAYTRDSNAQVTGENSTSYAYNGLNQLTTGNAGLSYSYDAAGRLTQSVNSSTTTNFNYDNADQLLSAAVVGGSTTNYGYDAAGRRTSAGSLSLTWDQQDRLLTYGADSSYSYNATGLRVSKTVAGQSEAFIWDTVDGLPLLLQDGTMNYVTGPGGVPLEQVSGSTVYYYQQDQLGSTRALTDATGTVAASYTYDAFGNITAQTGTISNPFLFSGQYRDTESGLYYLRARYYDPATGQFLSRDPELNSTWEPYGYVADNPLNATDPSGLCFGFGDQTNWICDAFRNNIVSGAHAVMNWIGSELKAPEGRLLHGFVSGDTSITHDGWYNAGEVLGGLVLVVSMLDGLGEALGAARLLARFVLRVKADEIAADAGEKLAADIVYRGGSDTLNNLTPRAIDLEGEGAPGLSTWRTAEEALKGNAKVQVIDLNRLPADLQAIEEEDGHVIITTRDWESLISWSDLRGTDAANPLSEAIRQTIVGEVR
ncbi:MAG TPA: fibronectin type III domain-containing protein [Candidatus Acidoferrum sp.]|nr:fibronectin type III domain-containing protein [Candidatus Acidoferrum sp.]